MRIVLLAIWTLGSGVFASAEEDRKEIAREVILKDAKLEPAKERNAREPRKVASKEALAKAVEEEDTRAAIAKEIDFDKEYALIFTWTGSGEDRLVANAEKDAVTFKIVPGKTKDLRMHARVFAVAKGAAWSLAK